MHFMITRKLRALRQEFSEMFKCKKNRKPLCTVQIQPKARYIDLFFILFYGIKQIYVLTVL